MRCWYCGKETMVKAPDLRSSWLRCSSCGATWIEMPKLYFDGLAVEKVTKGYKETKYRPYHKRRRKQNATNNSNPS